MQALVYEPSSFGELMQLPLRELAERVKERIRVADVALSQQTRP